MDGSNVCGVKAEYEKTLLARSPAIENIRAGQEHGYNGFLGSAWLPGLFHGKITDATGTLFTPFGKPNSGARGFITSGSTDCRSH